MPIATKNNSLILKDGKLADGCGCCLQGFVCCAVLDCAKKASAVSVSIQADDVYVTQSVESSSGPYISSACVFGSTISGTHNLTKVEEGLLYSVWEKTFPSTSSCPNTKVTLDVLMFNDGIELKLSVNVIYIRYWSISSQKSKSDLACDLPAWVPPPPAIPFAGASYQTLSYQRVFFTRCFDYSPVNFDVYEILYDGVLAPRSFDEKFTINSKTIISATGSRAAVAAVTITP